MAQKGTSTTSKTTVRRIKATDDEPKKTASKQKTSKNKATVAKTIKPVAKKNRKKANPLAALGGYFKGAWQELKLVRWPTRSATWAMTVAVLAFTLVFVVLILLLDAGFNWAFEQILK